jgi:hypothetical protein
MPQTSQTKQIRNKVMAAGTKGQLAAALVICFSFIKTIHSFIDYSLLTVIVISNKYTQYHNYRQGP